MASHSPISPFGTESQKIVESFLQTVVMIDDRAFETIEGSPKPSGPPPSPVRPSFNVPRERVSEKTIARSNLESPSGEIDLDEERPIDQAENAEETSEDVAHELDAKRLIEQFSNKGIICAVLKPSEVEIDQFANKVYALSEAADVVILDWVWFKDVEGKKVSEVIARITKEASQQHRLRLILVYTGQKDLEQIIDHLSKVLTASEVTDIRRLDDFTVQSGGTRITVYNKGKVEQANSTLRDRMSPFDQLPNTVVAEFAKMTAGLIPTVAVASLAEIRRTSYRLLARFNSTLDAPFLAHRALLDSPSEGNEQLIPLIGAELEAILEDRVSHDLLSDDAIKGWLSTRPDPLPLIDSTSAPHIRTTEKARQAVRDLCLRGAKRYEDFAVAKEPSWLKHLGDDTRKGVPYLDRLTNLIAGESVDGSNEALELIMSIRPRYSESPPMLSLGTLVSSIEPEERTFASAYWLCLQPACDSYIRSGGPRRTFPLLRLKATADKFNLITKDHTGVIHLRWEPKPYKMRMFDFEANSQSGAVLAVLEDKTFWFVPTIRSFRFRWLGELKFPQAQRVAQALASEEARIGLTESQWLRRNAK